MNSTESIIISMKIETRTPSFSFLSLNLFFFAFQKSRNEVRRNVIEQYRIKRDQTRDYKQLYERCSHQVNVRAHSKSIFFFEKFVMFFFN